MVIVRWKCTQYNAKANGSVCCSKADRRSLQTANCVKQIIFIIVQKYLKQHLQLLTTHATVVTYEVGLVSELHVNMRLHWTRVRTTQQKVQSNSIVKFRRWKMRTDIFSPFHALCGWEIMKGNRNESQVLVALTWNSLQSSFCHLLRESSQQLLVIYQARSPPPTPLPALTSLLNHTALRHVQEAHESCILIQLGGKEEAGRAIHRVQGRTGQQVSSCFFLLFSSHKFEKIYCEKLNCARINPNFTCNRNLTASVFSKRLIEQNSGARCETPRSTTSVWNSCFVMWTYVWGNERTVSDCALATSHGDARSSPLDPAHTNNTNKILFV
jgi:hypothetical protein